MAVVGPTGVGKSALALAIARQHGAVILSVDSMQVYRGMDIGTAKPSRAERMHVRHEMIDVADPETDYTVADFQRDGRRVIEAHDGPVLIVGGSGLHLRAVIDPLEFPPRDPAVREEIEREDDADLVAELRQADPDADRVVDVLNRRRVARAVEILRITGQTPSDRDSSPSARDVRDYRAMLPVRLIGVDRSDAAMLDRRIRDRVDQMRGAGLLDEVRSLRHRLGRQAAQAVGYKQLAGVVDGTTDEETGFRHVVSATSALVKRQRTYFRRDPRIRWFDLEREADQAASAVGAALRGEST